jgi:hypothetical protein
MTNDEFRTAFFERYREDGDTCDDEWFDAFFEQALENGHPVDMDIEWENESDSGNFASGDESETLFSFTDSGFTCYWTQSTFSGSQGPFEKYDEAVLALGYDPAAFPPDPPEKEDEDADEDDDVGDEEEPDEDA